MAIWEYKVISSGKGGFATPVMMEKFLNDLGKEEWEIIEFTTPADNPLADPQLVRARETGVEYSVDVKDDTLYILTNDDHPNFRLATAPVDAPGEWTTLIAGSDDFYITDMTAFADFYTIEGRRAGLDEIQVRYYDDPDRIESNSRSAARVHEGYRAMEESLARRARFDPTDHPPIRFRGGLVSDDPDAAVFWDALRGEAGQAALSAAGFIAP